MNTIGQIDGQYVDQRKMKRLGRMTSLDQLTGLVAGNHTDPRMRDAWLSGQATRMFGDIIAGKIHACRLRGSCLILEVGDPAWREQLCRDTSVLLEGARRILPQLKTLVVAE